MILLEIIRDDGAIMSCGDASADYEVINKDGTGTVEVEAFYQEKGYGAGDIKTGQRVKGRTFSYQLSTGKNVSQARHFIPWFFNVLHTYVVRSYMNGRSLWIQADIASLKVNETLYGKAEVEVGFYAENPYWMALTDNKRHFDNRVGLWHYPYALVALDASLPEAAYSCYEQITINRVIHIFYDADVPTMPIIKLIGPVTDPVIHVNGALISYTGTVAAEEVLYLDPFLSVYEKDGVNVFPAITVWGDLNLYPGDNMIQSELEQFGSITFYKRYNGDV